MSQTSSSSVIQIFKKVYGQMNTSALPMDDLLINKEVAYTKKGRVGDKYVEAIVLGSEVGITFAGSGGEVFNINPAIAGAIRQSEISPSISVLRSVIPWQSISRSLGDDAAFVEATKHVVRNNMLSHKRFQEIVKIHGQNTTKLLGRVAYMTATYRGASFTNGGGTLTSSLYGSLTFTAGVLSSSGNNYILLNAGDFASGIWVGMQGVKVKQLLASNLSVVAEGKLISADSALGILKVDFTPVAASSSGSHILAFEGMEVSNEMVGIKKILKNTGTLFNINAATYPLWKGNVGTITGKLTFAKLEAFVADMVNAGGLSGDLKVYVNPRTFHNIVASELAARQYDYSYNKSEIVNGGKAIRFAYAEGDLEIIGHRYIMEGDCLLLKTDEWMCSGSQDIATQIEGMPEEKLIFQLQDQGAYVFHTYGDVYMFCRSPAKNGLLEGINDESAT